MTLIADFLTNNPANGAGKFQVRAGAQFAQGDGVQLGLNGKGFPIKTTDYSVVTNYTPGVEMTSLSTGRIVAETMLSTAGGGNHRQAVEQGVDGSIYSLTPNATTQGLKIFRHTAMGGLVRSVLVDATALDMTCQSIATLSNGNLVVLYLLGTNPATLKYAVFNPELNTVVAPTAIAADIMTSGSGFGSGWQASNVVALTGGWFALTYLTTVGAQQLLIFGNGGGAPVFNAVIKAWAGALGAVYSRMAVLSDGNLQIASRSNMAGDVGVYYGIWSPAGAQVKAFTQLDTGGSLFMPAIATAPGYFCIARVDNTGPMVRATVFDNAGTIQGASFTAPTATSLATGFKLLTDGAQFLFLWQNSNGSYMQLTKLPLTGVGYVTSNVTPTTPAGVYNGAIDAFCENGIIVVVAQPTISGAYSKPILFTIFADSGALVDPLGTYFGTLPTTGGTTQRVIPGGDFTFICLYDFGSPSQTMLFIGKYGNTCIVGAALAAAGLDTLVSVGQGTGAYGINRLRGTPSKPFDHTTGANIYGNKGAILTNGLVLRGM